ncbi:hypothetical protein RR46_06508 [Papilio xuthus]|uniref:Uncharacterized protein n=1 Tax=Papilio xuthus TaxID=66420 RepID=A0A194QD12_PAPXU|nr:hypothetical protein RR46_06508 [Papilio xuthus]
MRPKKSVSSKWAIINEGFEFDPEDDASACDSDAAAEAAAAFARACAPDTQRLLAPHSPHTPHTPRRIHDHDE